MKSNVLAVLLLAAAVCRAEPPPVAQPFPQPNGITPPPPTAPETPQVESKFHGPAAPDTRPLDAARLEHGRSQVRQLFLDRYVMSAFHNTKGEVHKIGEDDAIFQWLTRKFAGEDTGEIVFWDSEPPKGFRAVHSGPSRHWLGFVQIGRFAAADEQQPGRMLSFEEMWMCGVFEMINMGRDRAWQRVEDKAANGTMTKEEFVEAGAKFEFQGLQACRDFYAKTWLPWANAVGFESSKEAWRLPLPSFEQWRGAYTDHAGYPWKPFEDIYDSLRKSGRD